MTSELSIGNEIKDGFKETSKWVQNNLKWLSELESFYRERAKLEKDYSSRLTHLAGEYFGKKSAGTVALSVGDAPTTTPGSLEAASLVAWNEILSQTEKMSQDHNQLAQEFEFQVADQLVALGKKCDFLVTTINGFNTALTEKRDKAYLVLEKAKKSYDEKCIQMESARAKQTKSSSDKAQRKAGGKEHEMNIAKNHYLVTINQANRIKDKYYFQDVPEVLDLLQDLHESRTRVMNSIWVSASSLERDMCKRIDARLTTADSVVSQNKPGLDSTMFIKHNLKDWKEPADFQYVPSSVWHDDEQFVVSSSTELQDLKIRLAKAQQVYDQMQGFASSEIGDLTSLNKQRQGMKSQDGLSGEQTLALLSKYVRSLTSYTSHETAKLEALVEIESIQNNVPEEHDLSTDGIDLDKLGKKSGVFNRFKKSLTISSEKKATKEDNTDMASTFSTESKSKNGNHLSFFRGRSRAQTSDSRFSANTGSDANSATERTDDTKNAVLFSYQKTDNDETSVTIGDNFSVLAPDSGSGWTKIKNETTGDTGLVPTSYIAIREAVRSNAPRAPPPRKSGTTRSVEAVYSYEAQEDGELSITEGDNITVLREDDGSGWTFGELNGMRGLFPTSYCK
ncbi:LAME_0H06722g1_1 [Lachancea meyersii CBS 8951]|uniref:Protein BZZ1 n=1 Tax=Lachancea meyersii CBS 8951 TaxID=1266667 RepID=A0A1G4KER3_9SACH|nr:LAME_0H06722g1_1 [Lachancea meyersii CBS 8951]